MTLAELYEKHQSVEIEGTVVSLEHEDPCKVCHDRYALTFDLKYDLCDKPNAERLESETSLLEVTYVSDDKDAFKEINIGTCIKAVGELKKPAYDEPLYLYTEKVEIIDVEKKGKSSEDGAEDGQKRLENVDDFLNHLDFLSSREILPDDKVFQMLRRTAENFIASGNVPDAEAIYKRMIETFKEDKTKKAFAKSRLAYLIRRENPDGFTREEQINVCERLLQYGVENDNGFCIINKALLCIVEHRYREATALFDSMDNGDWISDSIQWQRELLRSGYKDAEAALITMIAASKIGPNYYEWGFALAKELSAEQLKAIAMSQFDGYLESTSYSELKVFPYTIEYLH